MQLANHFNLGQLKVYNAACQYGTITMQMNLHDVK